MRSTGNPDLTEASTNAYEAGYTGVLPHHSIVTAAVYLNKTKNDIFFTEVKSARWTATNPPPQWPLNPLVIPAVTGGAGFPALFTYQNFGETTQKGVELGIDTADGAPVSLFANYSWQAKPEPKGFDISELNLPPENRYNVGGELRLRPSARQSVGELLRRCVYAAACSTTVTTVCPRPTRSSTPGFGVKWGSQDRVVTTVKVTNLANQDIQQHVFGDITKRQIVGEMRVQFGGRK